MDLEWTGFSNFTGLKEKYPNMKTILSVGGWAEGGYNYSEMVSFKSRREAFVKSAVGKFTAVFRDKL